MTIAELIHQLDQRAITLTAFARLCDMDYKTCKRALSKQRFIQQRSAKKLHDGVQELFGGESVLTDLKIKTPLQDLLRESQSLSGEDRLVTISA